jgi:hypothetical protein
MLLEAAFLTSLGAAELRWDSVAGCPDAAAVARELGALVREDVGPGTAEVEGRLAAERGAYVLRLEVAMGGRREARELRANDCVVLTRAGVLVAAVTLDALATAAAVNAGAAAAPEPLVTVAPPTSARVDPFPRERPTSEPRVTTQPRSRPADRTPTRTPSGGTLAASAGVAQGMTPGVTGGLEGQLGWRRGALRLAVGGFHWFSRTAEVELEVGVEAALSGASLRGCVAFERARLEVPVCAGVDLAAMHGGGVGDAVVRRDANDLWVGVAAGAGLVFWGTRRFALQARAEGVLGARRPAMYLEIEGEPRVAFRMPPVGVRLLVGPMIRLW